MTNKVPLLDVRQLTVAFRSGAGQMVQAVKDVSFQVEPESTVALVGESGSGKSVSALAVMGLLPERSARVSAQSLRFKGTSLLSDRGRLINPYRGNRMTMVFQDPMTSLNPVYSVGYQVAEMLRVHRQMSRKDAQAKTIALFEEVGISDPAYRFNAYPHELSGGQQQRVMIAMALACEPELLIADEPTTALDVTVQKQILDLMADLRSRRRMAMIFISHDLSLVGQIADHVVVMQKGTVCENASSRQIFQMPSHVYTRALLSCRPTAESKGRRLLTVDDWTRAESAGAVPEPPAIRQEVKPGEVFVTVQNLSKSYMRKSGLFSQTAFHAVDDVSFDIRKGETLGLVGESGSGKSTIGLMLMRLITPTKGKILVDGQDLVQVSEKEFAPYRRRFQVVFQNPYASLNPRFTIGQILAEPMWLHGIGKTSQDRENLSKRLLDRVGLPEAALKRYPHEFSGGQRQRIMIARCLTVSPDLVVCDEAVSALDVSVQAQVLNLLKDLQQELGLSYLFISHDLSVVQYMSDRIIVLKSGKIVEKGDTEAIYQHPRHEYTQALLRAVPTLSVAQPAA
jgi:peptide/nickel transport system ATP-binding protein